MTTKFHTVFSRALAQPLDRAILVRLEHEKKEMPYEKLRKAVDEPAPQTFKYAIDRLMRGALVNRRLKRWGRHRFRSFLSPTPTGRVIARVFASLGEKGSLPKDLPRAIRAQISDVLVGAGSRAP